MDPWLDLFGDDYNPFRYMAPASARALERERTCKGYFHQAKSEFEKQQLVLGGDKHVLEDVVPPYTHLTSHTWKTFRQWVENYHSGWKAKRRGKK